MTFPSQSGGIVVLGNFDGVHLGHRALLDKARELSCGEKKITVRTFGTLHKEAITPGELRFTLLRRYGADEIITDVFEDIKNLSPETFVKEYLNSAGFEYAVCGFNYRFGKDRTGDTKTLETLFSGKTVVVPETKLDGTTVSSTLIRELLKSGRTEDAVKMLGHPFTVCSRVTEGKKLGRTIGVPTLNQKLDGVVPKAGVYYGYTVLEGKKYPTVTAITSCPTVGLEKTHVETHVVGFEGDLYGKAPEINVTGFIRAERTFPDINALKEQMKADIETAKKRFNQRIQ